MGAAVASSTAGVRVFGAKERINVAVIGLADPYMSMSF
jgi:hypothetical protein